MLLSTYSIENAINQLLARTICRHNQSRHRVPYDDKCQSFSTSVRSVDVFHTLTSRFKRALARHACRTSLFQCRKSSLFTYNFKMLTFASNLHGGVAQMVERSLSMREVRGSMPRTSIHFSFSAFVILQCWGHRRLNWEQNTSPSYR